MFSDFHRCILFVFLFTSFSSANILLAKCFVWKVSIACFSSECLILQMNSTSSIVNCYSPGSALQQCVAQSVEHKLVLHLVQVQAGVDLHLERLYYMQASFRNSGSGVQPQVNATTTIGRLIQDVIGQDYLLSSNWTFKIRAMCFQVHKSHTMLFSP